MALIVFIFDSCSYFRASWRVGMVLASPGLISSTRATIFGVLTIVSSSCCDHDRSEFDLLHELHKLICETVLLLT